MKLAATRAVHKTPEARNRQTVFSIVFQKELKIGALFDTYKKSDRKRYIEASAMSVGEHSVKCQ